MSHPLLPSLAIVGPGRLGRSVAQLLAERGIEAPLVGRGEPVPSEALVLLLTVPDRVLPELATSLPEGRIALHCSGASEVDVLAPHAPRGSWHPLMTFPGPEVALPDLQGVPAAIAGQPEALAVARALSELLGMEALEVPGDRRLYHAAAVLAGNLATVLLADAASALEAAGLDARTARRALHPLARRSLANAVEDPARALTGPVARGDRATLESHRDALRSAGLEHLVVWVELLEARGSRLLEAAPASD